MAGTVIADTWQNGDGSTNYKCRAWVNFNGTGTVAIRASGNVSSITDNGTGDYTVNFAAAMTDADYSISSTSTMNSGNTAPIDVAYKQGKTRTTSSCNFETKYGTSYNDMTYVEISFFR